MTARGQVTFRKEVLQHLGIKSGDKIELEFLPDGRAQLRAAKPAGGWRDLSGFLKDKGNGAAFSIEDLNEAIAEAGAKAGRERS
ncbi:AbrB/MazE/SpoVT family DNA-binding domain-containing protein [Methylobacterium sp. NFXW15]|uniref:AbrB/MazE/SpoVT family DNA-binding domain-containing protein n=1 Tax=Methylobacterium sp. NFXW15 TaxID=2819512 RepID=UPI003CF4B1F5